MIPRFAEYLRNLLRPRSARVHHCLRATVFLTLVILKFGSSATSARSSVPWISSSPVAPILLTPPEGVVGIGASIESQVLRPVKEIGSEFLVQRDRFDPFPARPRTGFVGCSATYCQPFSIDGNFRFEWKMRTLLFTAKKSAHSLILQKNKLNKEHRHEIHGLGVISVPKEYSFSGPKRFFSA